MRGMLPEQSTSDCQSIGEAYARTQPRASTFGVSGQTPDEMYFGIGDAVPSDLRSRADVARRARAAANRSASCQRCPSLNAAA